MTEGTGVLIIGELEDESISSTTCELLAAGRSLANSLGQKLSLGLAVENGDSAAQEGILYGAEHVFLINDPLLHDYQADLQLAAVTEICKTASPSIILIGRTLQGREIGPRLAVRLGVGLAQDCLEVDIEPETQKMVARRPVYGGNAMAALTCTKIPQIASVRPKAYEPLNADDSRQGETTVVEATLDASMAKVKLVERLEEETEGPQLETAKIVVAGGRGLGGPEPFQKLDDLAKLLSAAVGASRAVVDAGWLAPPMQIGLTGKTITPDLYITVAISGASQHMAGCSGAKAIVAINKDSEANIFKEARYGVVGDWEKVLPSFTETVRELVK
jgi:electron transfer flavoprotein alpha subunit